jgi:hypothetical protein
MQFTDMALRINFFMRITSGSAVWQYNLMANPDASDASMPAIQKHRRPIVVIGPAVKIFIKKNSN